MSHIEDEADETVRNYGRKGLYEADCEVARIQHGKGCRCKLCVHTAVNKWNFFAWLLGSNKKHLKAVPGKKGYEIQMNEDDKSGTI